MRAYRLKSRWLFSVAWSDIGGVAMMDVLSEMRDRVRPCLQIGYFYFRMHVLLLYLNSMLETPVFDVLVVGSGGGPDETNLSA